MGPLATSIITGVISGLISSAFLYVVLFRIKPNLKISDDICRDIHDGKFRIKIVNLTHSNLVDVKYTLHACYCSGDGIIDILEIPPVKSKLEFVQAYSTNEEDSDYAIRLSYDLSSFMSADYNYFLFTFYAKHSISGTATFVRKEFKKEQIKCGQFETGKSTKVLLTQCHSTYQTCENSCKWK